MSYERTIKAVKLTGRELFIVDERRTVFTCVEFAPLHTDPKTGEVTRLALVLSRLDPGTWDTLYKEDAQTVTISLKEKI